ncbi:MAG: exodeoxyribonuclease VII small subunit [Pseudomonadota bacterium]
MSDQTAASEIEAMSFEQAMAALEQIVGQLESGRVDLEQSITLYERGALLRSHCEAKLRSAAMRVEQIVQGADGAATGAAPAEFDSGR